MRLRGLSQSFSDRYASLVRGRDDLTSGYVLGFQTAEFLSIVASKQARQSATGSQIVRRKTLRQARAAPKRSPIFGECPRHRGANLWGRGRSTASRSTYWPQLSSGLLAPGASVMRGSGRGLASCLLARPPRPGSTRQVFAPAWCTRPASRSPRFYCRIFGRARRDFAATSNPFPEFENYATHWRSWRSAKEARSNSAQNRNPTCSFMQHLSLKMPSRGLLPEDYSGMAKEPWKQHIAPPACCVRTLCRKPPLPRV